jgi:hypothetical protein
VFTTDLATNIVLEVTPHGTLAGPVTQTLQPLQLDDPEGEGSYSSCKTCISSGTSAYKARAPLLTAPPTKSAVDGKI